MFQQAGLFASTELAHPVPAIAIGGVFVFYSCTVLVITIVEDGIYLHLTIRLLHGTVIQ